MSPSSSCRLCPLLDQTMWPQHGNGAGETEPCQTSPVARRHEPNFHNFRDCDQAIYTSVDEFIRHLRDEHNAWFPKSRPDLTPWQRVQVLEVPSTNRTAHRSLYSTRHSCCEVLDHTYTLATVSFIE